MGQETPRKRNTRYTRSHRFLKIYISLLSLHPIIQIQFKNKLTSHFYKSLTIKLLFNSNDFESQKNIKNFLIFNTLPRILAIHHTPLPLELDETKKKKKINTRIPSEMSRNKSSRIHGRESAVGRAQVRRCFLRVKKPARETAPAPSSPLPKRSRASRRNSNAVVASCSGSLYRRNCSVVQLVSEHRPQAESVALVTPG